MARRHRPAHPQRDIDKPSHRGVAPGIPLAGGERRLPAVDGPGHSRRGQPPPDRPRGGPVLRDGPGGGVAPPPQLHPGDGPIPQRAGTDASGHPPWRPHDHRRRRLRFLRIRGGVGPSAGGDGTAGHAVPDTADGLHRGTGRRRAKRPAIPRKRTGVSNAQHPPPAVQRPRQALRRRRVLRRVADAEASRTPRRSSRRMDNTPRQVRTDRPSPLERRPEDTCALQRRPRRRTGPVHPREAPARTSPLRSPLHLRALRHLKLATGRPDRRGRGCRLGQRLLRIRTLRSLRRPHPRLRTGVPDLKTRLPRARRPAFAVHSDFPMAPAKPLNTPGSPPTVSPNPAR